VQSVLSVTFQHLSGVTAKREADLWRSGVLTWDDYERYCLDQKSFHLFDEDNGLSPLALSRIALTHREVGFFAEALERKQHYRIALAFPDDTLFLDIETTGLSWYYDKITVIGWSLDGEYDFVIAEDNTDKFSSILKKAKVIVTFNGSRFDLPFLKHIFPNLKLPPVHVDLRFLARRTGLTGGQKCIETQLNFHRPDDLQEIHGASAPLLWYKYRLGDFNSFVQLMRYNHVDIRGMQYIFDKVVEKLVNAGELPLKIADFLPKFFMEKSFYQSDREITRTLSFDRKPTPLDYPKPLISLYELGNLSNSRVVGIDLTGSESRPSGWCLLEGDHAVTASICSDAELIAKTIAERPQLISIDSPLSLPKGRTTVFDDDPGRQQFGIMRYCEKILKQRGVNVYPALIPSMQRLTARGIRLAEQFRRLGYPVIESYPGAAQDIMNIPRKRAGLEFLAMGLKAFGIRGNYITDRVTHDELDAITSALVGYFFWSGRFEALGNLHEEFLIIPDLRVNPSEWRGRRVIGVSGSMAAGKTMAARYLESKGFFYHRFSTVLEEILKQQGEKPSRCTLQALGDKVHKQPGQRWLGKQLIARLPTHSNVVIDGIRFPEDHALLVETFGPAFRHVSISVPEAIRQERYIARGGNESEFAEASSHAVEQGVTDAANLAHAVIVNTGCIDDLYMQLDSLIS
jgi:uncharacterized protein YprB with RNaseH-like and TPR domain/predicted nuclease with RNAse H fold/dephospho-CoA kinase